MPKNQEITILYEDASVLVCVKPPGIASQGAKGFQTDLTDLLKLHIKEKNNEKAEPYLGIVHRLDQPTGGIMVFAKNPESAAVLSAQAASGQMKKKYYVILEKNPTVQAGRFCHYLQRNGKTNTSAVVNEEQKNQAGVKKAELIYKVLDQAEYMKQQIFLAEVELKTGRHHQIRVQFSYEGYPLYGDRKYNSATRGRELGLFAYYLEFSHPETKKKMQFEHKPSDGVFSSFFY